MPVIEGRCPRTGDVLQVKTGGGVITQVRRRVSTDRSLPWVTPGLIDLQVNGYAGRDVNGAQVSPDQIAAITEALAVRGVTSWVPTVITADEEAIIAALRAVSQARRDARVAAAIPFVHVEGPFLSPNDGFRGAHDRDRIRPLDAAEVLRWNQHGPVGMVTVSPHTPDAPRHIAALSRGGVRVSLGHTDATPAQLTAAVDAGARCATHLGNGIPSVLPRHPNPVWTQLADDRLTCGFIGDGHHLPADTLVAMVRSVGPGRRFLVSDSVALAGSPPGRYSSPVGGAVELHENGRLTLADSDLLAGSGVDLADVLAWVITHTCLGITDVVEMTSTTPARIIGADDLGRVQAGARADLILVEPGGDVVQVVRQGELV